MAIVSLNELKSYFQTGDYPTEQQFGNFIDTMGNVLEVVNNIGSKLFHDPSISYPANSAVMTTAGIWYNIDPVGPAAFNTDDWTLLFSFTAEPNVVSLGVPSYESTKNDYTTGNQVNWKNVIYEAIDGPFGGIEPGVDPSWEDYWQVVVYTEGGVIPVLTSGFVKFDRVYEYQGNDAPKGLYRSVAFEGGYDGGYKMSIGSFATDLGADKWALVAVKEASGSNLYVTISLASWNTLVGANGLVPGWQYLVTGAYTSPLYGTSWNILVTARTVNAISTSAWVSFGESLGEILVPCVVEDAAFGSLILYSGLPVGLLFLTANLVLAYAANPAYALGVDVIISSTTGNFFKCQVSAYDRSVLILNNVQAQNDGVTWKKGDFGTYKPQTSIDAGDDVFVPYQSPPVNFKISISSGDIYDGSALNIEALPPPGAGYAWVVTNAQIKYTYVSQHYDDLQIKIQTNTNYSNQPQFTSGNGLLSTSSYFGEMVKHDSNSGGVSIYENADVLIYFGGSPTQGSGSAIIYGQAIKLKL